MSLFDHTSRDKPLPVEPIKTHDLPECLFAPVLHDCPIRQKVHGSGYGPDAVATKKIKGFSPPPTPKNQDEYYNPKIPKCALRESVSSSGYGVRAVKSKKDEQHKTTRVGRDVVTARSEASSNPNEIMPKRLKSAIRLKDSTVSSGYAHVVTGGRTYSPRKPKRGEELAANVTLPPERNPTFQPQLHLSAKARKLRDQISSRRLQPKKMRSDYGLVGNTTVKRFEGLPNDLLKTPTREMPPDTRDNDGFILDGVALRSREQGSAGNHGRVISTDNYHGTSFNDIVSSPAERDTY
eukprot:m.16172 g.16172  ORF g.16172 m.16172 type:complete len:294 (+) comp10909_c0_seq1:122-1003(+)